MTAFLLTPPYLVQYFFITPHPKENNMTTTPLTAEERLSRLEGVYDHLATKADLAELKAELKGEFKGEIARVEGKISDLKAEISDLKGSFRTLLIAMTSGLALLNILLRFWPQ